MNQEACFSFPQASHLFHTFSTLMGPHLFSSDPDGSRWITSPHLFCSQQVLSSHAFSAAPERFLHILVIWSLRIWHCHCRGLGAADPAKHSKKKKKDFGNLKEAFYMKQTQNLICLETSDEDTFSPLNPSSVRL